MARADEKPTLSMLFDKFVTDREIVEAHEGKIWMEPNADGGITFRIRLPVVDDLKPLRTNQGTYFSYRSNIGAAKAKEIMLTPAHTSQFHAGRRSGSNSLLVEIDFFNILACGRLWLSVMLASFCCDGKSRGGELVPAALL